MLEDPAHYEPPRPPPATAPTLPEVCAARLRREIVSGERRPGSKLPSERELASQLGVTKPTLRSALHQLLATKLLRVRQGSGYFVRDFVHDAGPGLLPELTSLASDQGHLPQVAAELLRVRRYLAMALIDRLVEVSPDLTPVDLAVDAFDDLARSGASPQALASADAAIVHTLLSSSDSLVLQLCFNPVRQVLEASPRLCAALYATPEANTMGWRALVAWLREPTGDRQALLQLLAALDADTLTLLEAS